MHPYTKLVHSKRKAISLFNMDSSVLEGNVASLTLGAGAARAEVTSGCKALHFRSLFIFILHKISDCIVPLSV